MSLYCSLLSDTNDTVISQHPNLFMIQIVNCLRVPTHLVTIEEDFLEGGRSCVLAPKDAIVLRL